MSDYYKPITWSRKHCNLNWINSIVTVHDLQCACNNPLKHTIIGIINQEPSIKFNKEESTKIQKCLTTGDQEEGDILENIGEGDLEAFFAADFGEEDAETR